MADDAILRPLTADDVTRDYVEGLNDPVVHEFLEGPRERRQTEATVRDYVRSNAESDTAVLFGLFLDGALRGTVRLHDLDAEKRTAWIGIALFDRSIWGQGWGPRMIDAVQEWARTTLDIKTLQAGILHDNARSQRAFEKVGFYPDPDRGDDERRVWVLDFDLPRSDG